MFFVQFTNILFRRLFHKNYQQNRGAAQNSQLIKQNELWKHQGIFVKFEHYFGFPLTQHTSLHFYLLNFIEKSFQVLVVSMNFTALSSQHFLIQLKSFFLLFRVLLQGYSRYLLALTAWLKKATWKFSHYFVNLLVVAAWQQYLALILVLLQQYLGNVLQHLLTQFQVL